MARVSARPPGRILKVVFIALTDGAAGRGL
jgi:hypothetical protein